MVNDVRNYSSTTRDMSLLGACDVAAESISLDSLQGLPTPPFTLILSAGTTSEEVVLATGVSGSNVTIARAQGGTTARSHTAGAPVIHGLFGGDAQEWQDHVQSTGGAHGVTGPLAGTTMAQTLTNKTMSGADNTFTDIPGSALAAGSVPDSALGPDIDAATVNGNKITVSATAPVSPTNGDIWIDIS